VVEIEGLELELSLLKTVETYLKEPGHGVPARKMEVKGLKQR
jgi:cytochrome c2